MSACVHMTVCMCARVCMGGGVLMGNLINGNERTELKRNWSIVKQTGINNPLDVICGLSGDGGGAEEEPPPSNIFFLCGASTPSIWSRGEAAPE